ncbi:5'/3'-nucleotidase SurE [bacterium]|nr:5'/3'-nucleotidase SurE [bacterium]
MRILLCNDDGYQAMGIQTLAATLRSAGHDITIVAPNEERSGQSHAMTFFRPVLVRKIDPATYAVYGTPADCAFLALHDIFKNSSFDLVISGINHGLNVGWDVNYSGTVGAATEAASLGYKAIAVSVDLEGCTTLELMKKAFQNAAQLVLYFVEQSNKISWPKLEVLNLNHPGLQTKGLRTAACGSISVYVPTAHKMTTDELSGQGTAVYMIGGQARRGSDKVDQDVNLIQAGYATASFLEVRQASTTNTATLNSLVENYRA